jgi:hypothetical protein
MLDTNIYLDEPDKTVGTSGTIRLLMKPINITLQPAYYTVLGVEKTCACRQ